MKYVLAVVLAMSLGGCSAVQVVKDRLAHCTGHVPAAIVTDIVDHVAHDSGPKIAGPSNDLRSFIRNLAMVHGNTVVMCALGEARDLLKGVGSKLRCNDLMDELEDS